MTNNDQDAPIAETAAEHVEDVEQVAGGAEDQERADNPNREAAKYRRQLREAEAERDQLRETVTGYRRAEVEKHAEAAGMVRGADLFDLGADLGELLAEDGTVDPEKVTAAATAVLADRPHWRRPPTDFDLGARPLSPAGGPTWAEVIRRA